MSALNQLADLKTRLDAKLEYMMSNHTDIMLEVKIKAPLLILSESGELTPEKPTDLLLVDLGYIHLCTEKLAKLEATRGRQININLNDDRSKDTSVLMSNSVVSDGIHSISPVISAQEVNGGKSSGGGSRNAKFQAVSPLTIQSDDGNGGNREQKQKFLLQQQQQQITEGGDRKTEESRYFKDKVDYDTVTPQGGDDIYGGDTNPTPKASHNNSYTGLFNLEGDDEEEELFDIFKAQLTQLEVYMVSSGENWRELTPQQITSLSIIDRFDISAEIHSSVLPWDSTLPPIKLYIDLPELHVRLSEDTLCRLAHFCSSLADSSQRVLNTQYVRIARLLSLLDQRKVEGEGSLGSSRSSSLSSPLQTYVNNKPSGEDENDDELSLLFYGKLSILPFNFLVSFFTIIEVRIIIIYYFLIVGS